MKCKGGDGRSLRCKIEAAGRLHGEVNPGFRVLLTRKVFLGAQRVTGAEITGREKLHLCLEKKRGGNLSRSRMTRRGEANVTGILVPPPRPRLLDVPTVSRVRANTGVFASNVKQRTRVAFEQTDNLYLETDWPVSFQLRLSFVRISFGGFFYRSVEFSWRGLCASSRSCRLSRWNSRTLPAGVYAAN